MKIKQIVSLIDFGTIPFLAQPQQIGGPRAERTLPIYATEKGVCYYEKESIWSIGIAPHSKKKIYEIKNRYLKTINDEDIDFDKYIAIYEILYAINEYKGIEDDINFDVLKKYVDEINKIILNELDFQQVPEMKTLKKIIMKNKLYNQMIFCVDDIRSIKEKRFLQQKTEEKRYVFGNIKYHEELDKVNITIYDDCVELVCEKEGKKHTENLNKEMNYTSEDKIISALDCWRNYFLK